MNGAFSSFRQLLPRRKRIMTLAKGEQRGGQGTLARRAKRSWENDGSPFTMRKVKQFLKLSQMGENIS